MSSAPGLLSALAQRYSAVRRASKKLAEPLSPEDCQAQSMTEASPVKWQLGHTTWFFETFVLASREGFRPFDPVFKEIFNSYYNAVGEQHPRHKRGMLTRPSLERVFAYRREVDEQVMRLIKEGLTSREEELVELGTHHEQQHQELILTDLKHLLFQTPLLSVYRADLAPPRAEAAPALTWVDRPGGTYEVGHAGGGFSFDNEGPRHRVYLEPHALADRPVTNAEYLEFMEDEGYGRAELWLADGWDWVQREGVRSPLYWVKREGRWMEFTLGGLRPLNLHAPVVHVSFYESNAYANWKGCRLPTEFEWECAAREVSSENGNFVTGDSESGASKSDALGSGNFVEKDLLHPEAAEPGGPGTLRQMFGDVWEWTQSAYSPYPGFKTPEGAVGEYNGKFMANQLVLRGGSCATSESHIRGTYRNFFYPQAQWQFSGIRLASR